MCSASGGIELCFGCIIKALQEEAKSLPFGAVWDYHCASMSVPVGESCPAEIKRYESTVLCKRV